MPHSYGNSHAIWDHTVLPATWQIPTFTWANRFRNPGGMQGWVDQLVWLHTEVVYPPKNCHPFWY